MQVTEEQLSEITRIIEVLKEKKLKLDRRAEDSLRELSELNKEIEKLEELLLGGIIEQKDNDIIGLGSRFSATLWSDEFEAETEDYVISDSNIKMAGFYPITPNTPFGKAVIGKKEGDSFEYTVNGFNNKGIINEIYKVKKEVPKQKTIEK